MKMIDLKAKGAMGDKKAFIAMEEMGLCRVLIDFYKWWNKTKGAIF